MTARVLIIEDDPVQRRLVEAQVTRMGCSAIVCDSGAAGLAALAADPAISAVVLDLVMPGLDGLGVLAEMRRRGLTVPVIVQTARDGTETVVAAMRAGAFDFVLKPADPGTVGRAIGQAIRMKAAREAVPQPGAASSLSQGRGAMAPVLALARKAAQSGIPLLLTGETGTGKEWLAEAIRAAGPRAGAPFVALNCGALPPGLAESILFGHERGAFTGAGERRAGKFVEADGGTLFLDEIGDLPLETQVTLLRVLQKGEVDPVGGRGPVKTDVRIIAATNRDLLAEVAAGRFREDLYYRLDVLSIRMPPLRERSGEIAGLARGFLERFRLSEKTGALGLSQAALDLLRRYDWPGNVRQLENAMRRAVVLSEGAVLGMADFPQIAALMGEDVVVISAATADLLGDDLKEPGAIEDGATAPEARSAPLPVPSGERLSMPLAGQLHAFGPEGELRTAEAVEADLIRLAVARYRGRMSEVARRLGIGRSTLYRKMRLYQITDPDDGDASGALVQAPLAPPNS